MTRIAAALLTFFATACTLLANTAIALADVPAGPAGPSGQTLVLIGIGFVVFVAALVSMLVLRSMARARRDKESHSGDDHS